MEKGDVNQQLKKKKPSAEFELGNERDIKMGGRRKKILGLKDCKQRQY